MMLNIIREMQIKTKVTPGAKNKKKTKVRYH